MSESRPASCFHNQGLFAGAYFERVLADPSLPAGYALPPDALQRLEALRAIWRSFRPRAIVDVRSQGRAPRCRYVGLPEHYEPLAASESDVENPFIRRVCEDVLGYGVVQNRTLRLPDAVAQGLGAGRRSHNQRPDLVLFADPQALERTVQIWGAADAAGAGAPPGDLFCRSAALIVDAKRFNKGVGADEDPSPAPKRRRTESSAIEDIEQVALYLRGYDVRWGVLTNGRSWRLMRQGLTQEHLRFDLVLFLEDLGEREPDAEDLQVFGLFWQLFGIPAVAGGYLDALLRESEASTRRVREVLQQGAHDAVETIAQGFWGCVDNAASLTVAPALPPQAELDHLREVSLTLLYRLLFVLKAEAQGLLPLKDERGASTGYARLRSSGALFRELEGKAARDRTTYSDTYRKLQDLFRDINVGSDSYEIPAYDGGLFDPERHPELARWRMLDESLYQVLKNLIYMERNTASPVPYADLDVRDLGDIYEGLLEQWLTGRAWDPPRLELRNERGERKASGSYFTPDGIVDHLVRRALVPLLEACGDDQEKILALRILDPAMGSGHFLVKAVDVMADYLTVHCDAEDPAAPRDNGPAERAYWKRRVVESCIYGVDYNPMAVELARVSLWLHTAEYGRPLSFVDHHLKVGNSLVGARLAQLAQPGRKTKTTKKGVVWQARPIAAAEPVAVDVPMAVGPAPASRPKKGGRRAALDSGQLALPFAIDTDLFSGILASIRAILQRPSESAQDVKRKSQDYARAVGERLAAHRLLADLWCLQWFLGGSPSPAEIEAYEAPEGLYAQVKRVCGTALDANRAAELAALAQHPLVQRVRAARAQGYGPRRESFFHWQLEFPEVAFDEQGRPRAGFGFDAVVGNPPWDRIRPERRQFYGPYGRPDQGPDWDVAATQGASLERLIRRLQAEHPDLAEGWDGYEASLGALTEYLRSAGVYQHQVAEIAGRKTGGDPDLFRYFVERSWQALREGGRLGLIVPGTLWQAAGCTGLRRLLLAEASTEETFVFENYRKWAFAIHSSFKFTTVVARKEPPGPEHDFPAAFMLRDLRAVHGRLPERLVRVSRRLAERLSPGTWALLDLQSDGDARLLERLHAQHPALGSEASGWGVQYRRELDMTNDAWRFKTREWMAARGFLQVRPERGPDGGWRSVRAQGSPTAQYPADLPPGGEYWVAADPAWYRARGYQELPPHGEAAAPPVFVLPADAQEPALRGVPASQRHRIVAGGRHTSLVVGRSIHQFSPAAAAYVSGEGMRQSWRPLGPRDAALLPNYFVHSEKRDAGTSLVRVGFRDIASATNERSLIATVLPTDCLAGNKVPVLVADSGGRLRPRDALAVTAVLNGVVADWLLRPRVTTTVNWTYLGALPVPSREHGHDEISRVSARLTCTVPELSDLWDAVFPESPWTYASAERDPWERALLRAQVDAIVADLYGLSVPDYARVLAGFPLLDRDQPPLPGDVFVTEASSAAPPVVEREDWEQTPFGCYERKPRSFVTRDLALLTFMRRKGYPPPQDLDRFYREEVDLDPDGPLSRFRIGQVTDLQDRVERARRAGAVPYVPSSRGGGAGDEGGAAEEAEGEGD